MQNVPITNEDLWDLRLPIGFWKIPSSAQTKYKVPHLTMKTWMYGFHYVKTQAMHLDLLEGLKYIKNVPKI